MKKTFTCLSLLLALCISANAQFNYDFSVRQQTYQPLTSGTSANDTTRWDDEYYKVPIGFTYKMDGDTMSWLSCQEGFYATDTQGTVSGFMSIEIDLHDRGNAGGTTTQSPIKYETVGTTPNRIFKYEIHNAGMYDEYDLYSTNDDSLSHQVWLYEIDNAFEIHYGPSKISYPTDYHFFTGGTPVIGFMRNVDMNTGSLSKFYYLAGNSSAPFVDSTTSLLAINSMLIDYPASGTVYRFAPVPVSVEGIKQGDAQVVVLSNVGSNLRVSNNSDVLTSYSVISINGVRMNIDGQLTKGGNTIDIGGLASGMYLLHVQNENGQKVFKVMKH